MGVFIGELKNTCAVRAAMKINFARIEVILPGLKQQYPNSTFVLRHTIGIDTSKLLVARTGVRGANDLVWVGRAATYAAKMAALESGFTWITHDVDQSIQKTVTWSNQTHIWEKQSWAEMNNLTIHRSGWT